MQWTNEQDAIFHAARDNPRFVSVSAVAGAGKTTTATTAAKYYPPEAGKVRAAVVFERHNAAALESRLPFRWSASTTHKFGRDILVGRSTVKLKTKFDKYKTLCWDWSDEDTYWRENYRKQAEVVDDLLAAVDCVRLTLADPTSDESIAASLDRYGLPLPTVMFGPLRQILKAGWDAWKNHGVIDFGDMLWIPAANDLRARYQYDVMIVDEAQDLNAAQIRLLTNCLHPCARGLIVGDPAQAIQGFAYADYSAFTNVACAFNAQDRLPLSVCWRCPTSHLDIARELVPSIQAAPGAVAGVVEHPKEPYQWIKDRAGDDVRVICRYNAPLIPLCARLIQDGIRARIKGHAIGEALQKQAREVAKYRPGLSLRTFPLALSDWADRRREELEKRRNPKIALAKLDATVQCLTYAHQACGGTEMPHLYDFLGSIFSNGDADVWLSSVHRAKGAEAKHVLILQPSALGAKEDDSALAAQQEQNIKYVALTRSKFSLAFSEAI